MSAFLDLEASVAHDGDDQSSDSEYEGEDNFIVEEEDWDKTTDSPDVDLIANLSAPFVEEDRWGSLLERARACASTSESLPNGSKGFDLGLLDAAPELWVLSCIGIKAPFIMPHMEKQVWLEADMSADLKSWLIYLVLSVAINRSTKDRHSHFGGRYTRRSKAKDGVRSELR
ncbi:uncharacterized protein EV420DRAFT_1488152 [Desarmillaria tabescens]|uniref:Uncharacterized protein n=1 Tax=Armillaria tabescens TaxID=1929756 RepID=A0AA39J4R4_ARMTA|nr:uncharacterized protein EV420DRAFT_1488152 [Desarmillaria tabescens]KAK0435236.1 hypothetical protein EV420DRAFT_1488152 [Desarmillaria tabescens]